jgi:hypothetical protein
MASRLQPSLGKGSAGRGGGGEREGAPGYLEVGNLWVTVVVILMSLRRQLQMWVVAAVTMTKIIMKIGLYGIKMAMISVRYMQEIFTFILGSSCFSTSLG